MDLLNYKPLGDKENSPFFEEYLPKVYERRIASGLDELVREMAAVVVQVEHGDAIKYIAELAVMGPYRLIDAALTDTHRVFLLRSQPEFRDDITTQVSDEIGDELLGCQRATYTVATLEDERLQPGLREVCSRDEPVVTASHDDRVVGHQSERTTWRAARRPDAPMIPPPGCVAEPHIQRFRSGVR